MVKVIVGLMGGSAAGGSAKLATVEQLRPFLSMLIKHNVKDIDTARVYNGGKSEELVGDAKDTIEQHDFQIATKAPGFSPGSLSFDKVISNCNASLKALQLRKFDLYYFHGPDRQTPLEESCRAMNQLYQEGKFARFGISNFKAAEVNEIVSICQKNDWIKPTIYQGGYNPLLRVMEKELLPTLREHSIAFYAYSPLGGGYFSRTEDELRTPPAGGRMDSMKVFKHIYVNDVSLRLHAQLQKACKQAGIAMPVACLRWLLHHSPLHKDDGIILGGSSQEQMEQNLQACEGGSLPDSLVKSFEDLWQRYSVEGPKLEYSV